MKLRCPREPEVVAAIRSGRWPMACEPALRRHLDECERCADTVLIAAALRQNRAEAIQAAPLVSPGLLWWRAQLLRRQKAIEQVAKPISVAGTLALITSIIAVIGLVVGQRSQLTDWFSSVTDFPHWDAFWVSGSWMQAGTLSVALLIISGGTLGLLGGFVVYLAIQRE